MKKSKILTVAILLICGFGFIATGIFLHLRRQDYVKNGIPAQATIVRVDIYEDFEDETEYRVYVEFTVNGQLYSGQLHMYKSGMRAGQTVPIYYMPDNPNNFIYAKGQLLYVIFYVFGGIVLAFGLAYIFYPVIRNIGLNLRRKRWRTVQAKISSVSAFERVQIYVLGKRRVTLTCRDDEGNIYSQPFFIGPNEQFPNGSEINIYVHPDDPEKYKIDIPSFLTAQRKK